MFFGGDVFLSIKDQQGILSQRCRNILQPIPHPLFTLYNTHMSNHRKVSILRGFKNTPDGHAFFAKKFSLCAHSITAKKHRLQEGPKSKSNFCSLFISPYFTLVLPRPKIVVSLYLTNINRLFTNTYKPQSQTINPKVFVSFLGRLFTKKTTTTDAISVKIFRIGPASL